MINSESGYSQEQMNQMTDAIRGNLEDTIFATINRARAKNIKVGSGVAPYFLYERENSLEDLVANWDAITADKSIVKMFKDYGKVNCV